jgi:hypothetical protein
VTTAHSRWPTLNSRMSPAMWITSLGQRRLSTWRRRRTGRLLVRTSKALPFTAHVAARVVRVASRMYSPTSRAAIPGSMLSLAISLSLRQSPAARPVCST